LEVLHVFTPPLKVSGAVEVARTIVTPRPLIRAGIVADPLLVVLGVVRYSFTVDERLPSIILVPHIQIRIRKYPTNMWQLLNFV